MWPQLGASPPLTRRYSVALSLSDSNRKVWRNRCGRGNAPIVPRFFKTERKIKLVDEGGRSRQNAWGGNCAIESTLKKRSEHRESWVADCSKPARAFWWKHWGRLEKLEASDKPTQLILKPTQVMLAKSAAAWWQVPEHIKYTSPRLLGLSHVSRLSFFIFFAAQIRKLWNY